MKSAIEVMRFALLTRMIFSMTYHQSAAMSVGRDRSAGKPMPLVAARPTLP
jgi:hypothetical protein